MLWYFLVCKGVCEGIGLIEIEESSQHSLFTLHSFCYNVRGFIRIEHDHVLTWKVYLQIDNGRFLMVNWEFEQMPGGFGCSDMSTVSEFGYLVSLLNFQSSTIWSFMCIFCYVFGCCETRRIRYLCEHHTWKEKVSELNTEQRDVLLTLKARMDCMAQSICCPQKCLQLCMTDRHQDVRRWDSHRWLLMFLIENA